MNREKERIYCLIEEVVRLDRVLFYKIVGIKLCLFEVIFFVIVNHCHEEWKICVKLKDVSLTLYDGYCTLIRNIYKYYALSCYYLIW